MEYKEEWYESLVWMELAPSVECKWKRKSAWMDSGIGRQWIHDRKMKGGLKHLDIWMVSLDIYASF